MSKKLSTLLVGFVTIKTILHMQKHLMFIFSLVSFIQSASLFWVHRPRVTSAFIPAHTLGVNPPPRPPVWVCELYKFV